MDNFIYLNKKQINIVRKKDELVDTYKGWGIYFQVSNESIQTVTVYGFGMGLGMFCRYGDTPNMREGLIDKVRTAIDGNVLNRMVYKRLFEWVKNAEDCFLHLEGCAIKIAKNQMIYLLKEMPPDKLLSGFSFEFDGENLFVKQQ